MNIYIYRLVPPVLLALVSYGLTLDTFCIKESH
jgi:ferric iron reductase protein FhuF